MPERGRFTLLTVRGIPVGVDWSWFLVLFLIIWLLSGFYRDVLGASQDSVEPYVLAVLSAFGFFASILLHEFGHAIVALRNRIGISQITLWMFGGVASLDREPDSAGAEFRIAVAGPVVTLLITAACLAAGAAIDGSAFWEGASFDESASISTGVAVLAWLANINAIILVFNLLPAFPLDGGRITRAIAWRITGNRDRATIFAARLGQGFAYAFIGIGILLALTGSLFSGVWLALIGWMLGGSARESANRSRLNTRLDGLRVADVMDSEPVAIPAGATVEQALDEYFLRYRFPWFPVVDGDQRFLGLVNRGAADAVPEPSRASRTVAEILEGGAGAQSVSSDDPLDALLANVELRRLGGLPALDASGRLAGVITLEQLGRALRDAAA
ncbi:MAG TPA: site-2 protease family protein [Solirubrobacterales bacterium]|nr:site-2 protease family protein [Solirubrobacterales bacterium]